MLTSGGFFRSHRGRPLSIIGRVSKQELHNAANLTASEQYNINYEKNINSLATPAGLWL